MEKVKKYKCQYDKKHGCYTLVPCSSFMDKEGEEIPEEIMQNIKIHDFNYCFKISYKNILYDQIIKYVGIYHLMGMEGLKKLKREHRERIREIYSQPQNETRMVCKIIEELQEYTFKDLQNSEYKYLITKEQPFNIWW